MSARTLVLTCLLSLGFELQAQASDMGSMGSEDSFLTPTTSQILGLEPVRIEAGHRLMVHDDISVQVFATLQGGDAKVRDVFLRRSFELEILGVSNDGRIAHVGIDTNEAFYSDLYISVDDLKRARLAEVEVDNDLDEDLVDSSSEGMFLSRLRRGGMTYCYRDVKNTLLRVKKCARYASGTLASQGYDILADECNMKKVGNVDDPSELPAYSVCVSGGGRTSGCGKSGCGHIAIKLPSGMWFGAGTRSTPYLPEGGKGYVKRYKIGCLTPQ